MVYLSHLFPSFSAFIPNDSEFERDLLDFTSRLNDLINKIEERDKAPMLRMESPCRLRELSEMTSQIHEMLREFKEILNSQNINSLEQLKVDCEKKLSYVEEELGFIH